MAETSGVAYTTIKTNTSERFQSLRRELGVEGLGINAITLAPRQRGRIHDHTSQEEVFLVLDGELTIAIEGEEERVGRNGLVRVPSGVRRQLINRGPGTVLIVALGAAGEHVGRDGVAWESWDEDGAGRAPQEVPLPADLPV